MDDGPTAGGGSRLTLDIWHPNCWTLEVTEAVPAGLLGHGVHHVEGRARGRFTAYADSTADLDALLAAIEDSPLTEAVWSVDGPRTVDDEALAPGSATQGLVVVYDLDNSINDALVSRGFIPDEPVRMVGGREYWTVVVDRDRTAVRAALDEIRDEMDADVRVEHIAPLSDGVGSGMLTPDVLSERQREVFDLARKRGYYEWPREVSAADLADELGVSKPTLLEHLRKAEAKLLGGGEE
ncbi:helix-turn-helix domain-containing protein [Halomarina litorea]|uniref:helix-turn-helix domain-containing protein n=1 Tax=Halomarina litorea TaxID=2961595 RepID=UPI0020C371E5|nr:helix-turn-helix domain-containing protein [Halomarina sp. BCD28]